ncbi:MAG: S-layer homology domain-containing protein, partial [Ruminococcaceae bacterium]|nr:S-layer homology domain-containing protein [Oscillospiraceae bacterium]
MKKIIVFTSVLIALFTLLAVSVSAQISFNDVKESDWYYEAVKESVEEGIFTGTSKNEFSPKKGMSRAMFVTTLARLYEVDTSSYTGTSF